MYPGSIKSDKYEFGIGIDFGTDLGYVAVSLYFCLKKWIMVLQLNFLDFVLVVLSSLLRFFMHFGED